MAVSPHVISIVRCFVVNGRMFAYETTICATKLIYDDALYLGIFDFASPVNSLGKWDGLFYDAERKAGSEHWQTLFYLNDSWVELAQQGQLLSWITLFHGVFKVELRLLAETPQIEFEENETKHFLGDGKANRLFCPTGEIVVASLGDLGTDLIVPFVKIESGWYRVGFNCDDEKENEHYFLEDETQYPTDSSPDWIIYMQRVCEN